MWDYNIQTDHDITARRPDLVVVNNREQTCQIIDVSIPVDTAVRKTEKQKIEKYQDLSREVGKMWKELPVVMGSLGAVPRRLGNCLSYIDASTPVELLQKTTLLGTHRFPRKVLEIGRACYEEKKITFWLYLPQFRKLSVGIFCPPPPPPPSPPRPSLQAQWSFKLTSLPLFSMMTREGCSMHVKVLTYAYRTYFFSE